MNAIESTALVVAVTIAFFAWNRLPVVVVAIGAGSLAVIHVNDSFFCGPAPTAVQCLRVCIG